MSKRKSATAASARGPRRPESARRNVPPVRTTVFCSNSAKVLAMLRLLVTIISPSWRRRARATASAVVPMPMKTAAPLGISPAQAWPIARFSSAARAARS